MSEPTDPAVVNNALFRLVDGQRQRLVAEGLAEPVVEDGRVVGYRYRPLTDDEVADAGRFPLAALMRERPHGE